MSDEAAVVAVSAVAAAADIAAAAEATAEAVVEIAVVAAEAAEADVAAVAEVATSLSNLFVIEEVTSLSLKVSFRERGLFKKSPSLSPLLHTPLLLGCPSTLP